MMGWGLAGVGWVRLEAWLAQAGAVAAGVVLVLLAAPSLRAGAGAWLAASAGPAGAERVRVARAVDGDTLDLADGRTVRELGIDTPETHNTALAGAQPLGPEATDRMAALVEGRTVSLEADTTDRDHYG